MQWRRHTTQGFDRLQLGMVLQKLGRKVSFGSGSSHRESYQNIFRIFPLILGVGAVATTLLLGSYLWGLVSRKNKKEQEKYGAFPDLYPRASHKPNTVVALREFTKPVPSSSPKISEQERKSINDKKDFVGRLFDAEQDYAQVLAEARSHAAATQRAPLSNAPVRNSPITNGSNSSKHAWLTRSSSARRHNPLLDVEAVFPQLQDARFQNQSKSSKSWKKLLFWKRSKKTNQFEFNVNGAIHSSCTTPLHHMFKSSKTRATVAPTTPPRSTGRKPTPKRSSSGPLYSDGAPYTPTRNTRPVSGPLSGSSTPSRDGLFESAYVPLKRPASSPRLSSGPLYVP